MPHVNRLHLFQNTLCPLAKELFDINANLQQPDVAPVVTSNNTRSEEQLSEDSFEESLEEEDTMFTPTPKKKKSSSRNAIASPSHVTMGGNSPTIGYNISRPPVACPVMSGYFEECDFNNNFRTTGYVMIRLGINTCISTNDIEAVWQDACTLKIRTRWPEYFTQVLPMCDFIKDNEGRVVFDRNHPLTISFGKYVRSRMNEFNEVWDDGFITFDREMDTDLASLNVQVLDCTIGSKKTTLLQITAREAKENTAPKKMKAKVTSRAVKTGSSSGQTYRNTRKADDYESEESVGNKMVTDGDASVTASTSQKKARKKGIPSTAFIKTGMDNISMTRDDESL